MYFQKRWLFCTVLLCCRLGSAQQLPSTGTTQIHIRVLDANSEKPIPNEVVYVAFEDVKHVPAFRTDRSGVATINVKAGDQIWATTFWNPCGSRPLFATTYPYAPVDEILRNGLVELNPCGRAKVDPTKGEVVVFATKAKFWQAFVRAVRS